MLMGRRLSDRVGVITVEQGWLELAGCFVVVGR